MVDLSNKFSILGKDVPLYGTDQCPPGAPDCVCQRLTESDYAAARNEGASHGLIVARINALDEYEKVRGPGADQSTEAAAGSYEGRQRIAEKLRGLERAVARRRRGGWWRSTATLLIGWIKGVR